MKVPMCWMCQALLCHTHTCWHPAHPKETAARLPTQAPAPPEVECSGPAQNLSSHGDALCLPSWGLPETWREDGVPSSGVSGHGQAHTDFSTLLGLPQKPPEPRAGAHSCPHRLASQAPEDQWLLRSAGLRLSRAVSLVLW